MSSREASGERVRMESEAQASSASSACPSEDDDNLTPEVATHGLWQHIRYQTLHVQRPLDETCSEEDVDVTICGRQLTERYKSVSTMPRVAWHKCKDCFAAL